MIRTSLTLALAGAVALAAPLAGQTDRADAASTGRAPLLLKRQGSFFIGGDTKSLGPDNDITVNQMYVQYMEPEHPGRHVPLVLLHGCCLSGKTYETTPDGRMGWAEYFVRQGRAVYVPDQSSRARSGFDATTINQVKAGALPPDSLPRILQASHQTAWTLFRFGPTFSDTFPDGKFPVEAVGNLYKQMIPDLNSTLPSPNPTWTNLGTLADTLAGAVLMGHSESGFFPEQAALINPGNVRGVITIETAFCVTDLTHEQIATLAKIPMLVILAITWPMCRPSPRSGSRPSTAAIRWSSR